MANAALLSGGGCGQEDPNSAPRNPGALGTSQTSTGAAGAPAPGAAPIDDFYPLADGAMWVYSHTGGSAAWTEEVSVRAIDFGGRAAFEMSDTPGPSGISTVQVVVLDGPRALRVHKQELDNTGLIAAMEYAPGFPRYDEGWHSLGQGGSMTFDYNRVEHDAAGALVSDEVRSHSYQLMSVTESISVPAGTFDDCFQVRRERLRVAGTTAGSGDIKTFWFCAGVGKVREREELSGKLEELVSCSLPTGPCAR